jgi:hypothetical protein
LRVAVEIEVDLQPESEGGFRRHAGRGRRSELSPSASHRGAPRRRTARLSGNGSDADAPVPLADVAMGDVQRTLPR